MERFRRVVIFILLSIVILSSVSYGANTVQNNDKAEALNSLGLLKGTDKGYELEKASTRAESAAMIVRLLGQEKSALEANFSHPFNDIPQWAEPYIGYMYENGLTTGMSQDTYGSNEILDAKSYMTFILRVLGYNDSKGDFKWSEALEFANEIEILTDQELNLLQSGSFNRDGMVLVTYNALTTKFKENEDTLLGYLAKNLIISLESVYNSGLQEKLFMGTVNANLKVIDGRMILDLLFNFSDNQNIEDVYYASIIGSGPNKPTIEELLKRMTYSESDKEEIRKKYNKDKWIKDGNLKLLEENQRGYDKSPSSHFLLVIYNEDLDPIYYAEIPNNLEIGEYKIPFLALDEKFQEEIEQDEKLLADFVRKYMDKIEIISKDVITIGEDAKGSYAKIDRSLLADSVKDFKHASTSGMYGGWDLENYENQRNDLEHRIKGFWDFDNGFTIYERDIEDSKIYLRYNDYIRILLFSEDEEPVGYIVISR